MSQFSLAVIQSVESRREQFVQQRKWAGQRCLSVVVGVFLKDITDQG